MIERRVECSDDRGQGTALEQGARAVPTGPRRPQSMITSISTSPSRSKASARSSQTPPKCTALPGFVKPGRNSRRLVLLTRQRQRLIKNHLPKRATITVCLRHS